jgi:hypothetical protein
MTPLLCRQAAGWTSTPEGGWSAPCGTPEIDWLIEGYPLPEDADYPAWASAFYHYELEDYK